MEKFTITSPIITVETEAEKALIQKLYPGICHPDPQNHVLIAQEFTLEELADLKAKLAIADRLTQAGNFRVIQIEFDTLNRAQAIYIKNRATHNEIYNNDWNEVADRIEDEIECPDIDGPWKAEVNEVLTRAQVANLYDALYNLK